MPPHSPLPQRPVSVAKLGSGSPAPPPPPTHPHSCCFCHRVMQELCQVASATGATLVVPGIWEGPRLDGTCYQTTAVVTPWWEPSVVVGAGGPSTGPSPVPGPSVGHVAGPGSAVSPSSGPSGGGAPGEGAATPAPSGPPLVDVSEAVTLYHHRTVVGDVQVPGVFPGCVPSPCGVLGLLPDLDVTNGVFVKEVAEVRGVTHAHANTCTHAQSLLSPLCPEAASSVHPGLLPRSWYSSLAPSVRVITCAVCETAGCSLVAAPCIWGLEWLRAGLTGQ